MKNKIIVVKIGSSVFVTNRRKIDEFRVHRLTDEIAFLHKKGWKVILVVSGAVAVGMKAFKNISCEDTVRRCAAGIGQCLMMAEFLSRLQQKNITCAQILLTQDILVNQIRRDELVTVFNLYLVNHVIPILNENDVIDLNSFGGNDELSLQIAHLLDASHLIILSSFVSYFGVGGKKSKINVLEKSRLLGITARIADGKKPWIHFLQS